MYLSWLWGQAQTNFHSAKATIELKSGTESQVSLLQLCKDLIPPCNLSPFLFNGHLQTVWTTLNTAEAAVHYRRMIFEAEGENLKGSFAVDFVDQSSTLTDEGLPPRTSLYSNAEAEELGSLDSRPMLIILHGLSGGSYELYLRHAIVTLLAADPAAGPHALPWEICVVNARGCANSTITSSVIFNARATWDIRQSIDWLTLKYPNRKLYGMGFSLGANILVNYLAEESSSCKLKAAVVVSNPWNLDVGSVGLQRTWIGLHVYSRAMGGNVRKLFQRHEKVMSENPEIDLEQVKQVKFLHEFDRVVQCPTWGYPTEGAYYRDASSIDMIGNIRTPLLAINAEDDPIVPHECIPYLEVKQNPYIVLCTTSRGGHIGWFTGAGGGRWYSDAASAFLRRIASGFSPSGPDFGRADSSYARSSVAKRLVYKPLRRRLENNK